MNIGILVHSLTGNNLSVAQKLCDRLRLQGHQPTLIKLSPIGGEDTKVAELSKIRLEPLPALEPFDFLVFAGPVRGFSMSLIVAKCLSMIPSLKGKRVACFVTQAFSKPFLGGNRTISQMKKQCEALGGNVCVTGIVNWNNKKREQMIDDVIETVCTAV